MLNILRNCFNGFYLVFVCFVSHVLRTSEKKLKMKDNIVSALFRFRLAYVRPVQAKKSIYSMKLFEFCLVWIGGRQWVSADKLNVHWKRHCPDQSTFACRHLSVNRESVRMRLFRPTCLAVSFSSWADGKPQAISSYVEKTRQCTSGSRVYKSPHSHSLDSISHCAVIV